MPARFLDEPKNNPEQLACPPNIVPCDMRVSYVHSGKENLNDEET